MDLLQDASNIIKGMANASETDSYTKLKVPTQHIVSSNPTGVQRFGAFYIYSYSLMIKFHFAYAPSGAHVSDV
jgi:hypothetical protein